MYRIFLNKQEIPRYTEFMIQARKTPLVTVRLNSEDLTENELARFISTFEHADLYNLEIINEATEIHLLRVPEGKLKNGAIEVFGNKEVDREMRIEITGEILWGPYEEV